MPRLESYEPVLSGKASSYFVTLPKRKQRRLLELLYRLASFPGQLGDYESIDETGRKVQHLEAGPLVISFWADNSVRELRITDIEEL
jgi:hypothetical protein